MNLQEIKSSLQNISEGNTSLKMLPIWSLIMQEADKKGHFASDIVERVVMRNQRISEKQCWVVAYFAKNNNLINA